MNAGLKMRLKRFICELLCISMIAGSMSTSAFAAESTDASMGDPVNPGGSYEVVPDVKNASMTLFDENGNEIDSEDEAYGEALDQYNSILEQFSGRTIDMSDYDATDAILEVFGDKTGETGEDVVGEEIMEAPTVSEDLAAAADEQIDLSSGDDEEKETITLRAPMVKGDDTVWDCVWFGSYNGRLTKDTMGSIKWRVLETDGETALLLADRSVVLKPFNTRVNSSTVRLVKYKDSSLKKWAEKYFINDAFTTMEQQAIAPAEGEEKIFIPTWETLNKKEYGFGDKSARAVKDDQYWINDEDSDKYVFINKAGDREEAAKADSKWCRKNISYEHGFRPMVRISLDESDEWSYAGTVSLKGVVKEEKQSFVSELELDPGDGKVNGKESETVKLVKGKIWGSLPDAELDRHDFTGWYDEEEGGTKYTADSVIPEDVETLYAHYESKYVNTYHFKENVKLSLAKSSKSGEIPFLSNGFDFDFAGISTSLVYDRVAGTYEVGIGFDILRAQDIKDEGGFKNFLKAEGKDLEDTITKVWEALDSARDIGGSKPIRVDDGSWEPSLTVMGYAEGTLDDDGLSAPETGRLCIAFEIYKDMQWQTAIAFIPIALKLKFGAEGSLTFGIEDVGGNCGTTLVGDVEIVLPGIELRAGVGLARVASIGVYGIAQNKIEMEVGRDNKTGDPAGYWYLKGEAGGYVHFIFIDYKRKFIEGRLDILEWGNHSDSATGAYGSSDYCGLDTVGEYEVKRTHENPIKDWMEEPVQTTRRSQEAVDGFEFVADPGADDERFSILRNMYDMPEPVIVQSKDTSLLAFMAENDQEALTGNDVSAYYSLWDDENGRWGVPAHIDISTNTAEYYPTLTTDGNDIWAVWMDSVNEISARDAKVLEGIGGAELTDEQKDVLRSRIGKFEIKAAKYDKNTGKFASYATLTDDNVMSARPVATAHNGKVYVAWLTDDSVDLDMDAEPVADSGTESIMTAVFNGESWEAATTAESGDHTYTDLNVGMVDGKAVIAYGKDSDRKLSDANDDTHIYVRQFSGGEAVKLSEHEAHNPQFGNIGGENVLIWYENDGLRYTGDLVNKKTVDFFDASVLSPSFTVIDDSAFVTQAEDAGSVILCASRDPEYDPDDISGNDSPYRGIYAYVLYGQEDDDDDIIAGWPIYIDKTGLYGDVGTIAGFWETDDKGEVTDLDLVYPETRTDFHAPGTQTFGMNTTMFMTSFVDDAEIEIDEDEDVIDIEPEDIEIGKSVSLDFAIKNSCLNDVDEVWVSVRFGDREIKKEKIMLDETLEAGDEAKVTVSCDLPEGLKKGDNLTVRINSDQTMDNDEDREIDFNVGDVNLLLSNEVSDGDNGVTVTYSVENESILDTTGTFRLYKKNADDKKTVLCEMKDIEFPAKETVQAVFDEEELEELADYGDVIYAEVEDADGELFESALGDNEQFFKISRARIDKVTLSKEELTLTEGGKAALTATIEPADLAEKGVYWCSTDEDVATVDSLGNVTAKKAGNARIIATANDGSGVKAGAEVTVLPGIGSLMNRFDPVIDVKDENGNPVTLTVWISKSVSYNGYVHKTNLDKDKPKKYSRDLTVSADISIAAYADPVVKLKNNKVVQVKEKKTPTVKLSFKARKGMKLTRAQKKVIKALNKQLKKAQKTQPFTFAIAPADMRTLEFTPKYNKKHTKVTKLTTVIDGRKVRLSKKDFGYEFAADGTYVRVYAKGKNYIGDKTIPIDTK